MINIRLKRILSNMLTRCYNPKVPKYKSYGARGITVCDEWKNNHNAFYDWAINNGYQDNLTIDRIDVNGNYDPSNCRFITATEQARNKRNSIKIKFNDIELPLMTWGKCLSLGKNTLYVRHNLNWSIDKLLMKRGDNKTLYQHQVTTLGKLCDNNRIALYFDMGL